MPGQEDESRDESAVGAGRLTEENSQNDNYHYNGGTHDSPLKIVLIDNSLQKHNFITHAQNTKIVGNVHTDMLTVWFAVHGGSLPAVVPLHTHSRQRE